MAITLLLSKQWIFSLKTFYMPGRYVSVLDLEWCDVFLEPQLSPPGHKRVML